MFKEHLLKSKTKLRIGDRSDKYIIFKLEDKFFATPLQSVKEVQPFSIICEYPTNIDFFLGFIKKPNQIYNIVDIKNILAMRKSHEFGKAILVVHCKEASLAVIVDSLIKIKKISTADIITNKLITVNSKSILMGYSQEVNDVVYHIDIRNILDTNELIQISNLMNQYWKTQKLKSA